MESTERNKSEELFKKLAELEQIYSTAPLGLCMLDAGLRFTKCNEKLADMNGMPAADHIGYTLREILPDIAETVEPLLRRVLESGELIIDVVLSMKPNDGSDKLKYFSTSYAPVKLEDGVITGVSSIVYEITEYKKAEDILKRYQHIVSSSSDFLSYMDKDYIYQAVNDAYINAFNKSNEEIVGKHVKEILGAETFKSNKQKIDDCLSGNNIHFQMWKDFPAKGDRFLDVHYYPHRGDDGSIDGVVFNVRDITEQKQATEELRKSEERFDLAVKGTTDGLWDRDIKNDKSWYSPRFYELLGYQDGEIEATHQNFVDLVHPEDKVKLLKALHDHLEDRIPFALEHRLQIKSGEYRWFNARGQAIWDEQGKAKRMAGSIQDITESKNTEEKLRESEKQLKEAQHIAKLGFWSWDIKNNKIFYSDELYHIFGLRMEEFEDNYEAFLNLVHPEDRTYVQERINETLNNDADYNFDHRILSPDGVIKHLHVQGTVTRNDNGTAVRMFGITLDITGRKQAAESVRASEMKYRGLLESAPDGMVIVNSRGEIDTINQQLQTMLGYTREELVGQPMEILIPERFKDHKQQRDSYLEGPRLRMMGEGLKLFVRRKDGSEFPAAISLCPLETTDGLIVSAAIRDITERMKVEAELEQHREHLEEQVKERTSDLSAARDEAERANAAKSDFLSSMSHELRTPMNAILGFGQLLQMDIKDLNKGQQESVQEILDAGYHLLDLINDVLDLAKIESGKLDITVEEVHVDDVLEQCISLIEQQAKARQVELIDHISDKGYTVLSDYTRLKQVLLNLLSNAVKYNREQGSITIDGEIIDKQRLRIRVTDTGKGLTEADIAKLFTSFERLDKADNVEGTGIGLVISKHLAELMGGNIGVDSTPGEGSTFWVELALLRDA